MAIYVEIGAHGVSAKGFLAELGALPDAAPIDLRLNSPGGSMFDAVANHNALKRHEGTVTVWIDGIVAVAASCVAMAGDEIVMAENAFLMIHDPAGLVMSAAADMRAMAEALDKVNGISCSVLSRLSLITVRVRTPRLPKSPTPERIAGLMGSSRARGSAR